MSAIIPGMATRPTWLGRVKGALPPLRLLSRWLAAFWVLGGLMACGLGRPTPVPSEASLPPTPAPGVIEVLTTPEGASVSVNGLPRGDTPQRIAVSPGVYAVSMAKEGFESVTAEVTAEASRKVMITRALRDIAAPWVQMAPLPAEVTPDQGLKVSAQAGDNVGVSRMVLRVGDRVVCEAEEPTLRTNVDTRTLAVGQHAVIVQAWDEAGNLGEARATVEVVAPAPVPTPTAVEIEAVVPSRTPSPRPTTAPMPTVAPTTAPAAVVAEWGEITIDTYAYEGALYTDEAKAGHPYSLLHRDQVGAPRPRTYRVLRLRNDYLELTFLPELGGRLYQAHYLPTGQDLLYTNRAIKPTHWGPEDQGWWLAVGGMEFCLPVNEHGYLTAEPWDASVSRGADGSATAAMAITERSRNIEARVEVTLRPGEAGFVVRTTLHNPNTEARALQYWINAMLSPGSHGVQPSLRFYYPASEVIVHSRGEASLPDAHGTMSWPVYDGRDMSHYANWRDWLGFFAPNLSAPYTAVYDDAAALGVVRTWSSDVVQGHKLFAFGLGFGDSRVYTDDGSQYVEMWGGLSPTFWDDVTLASGATLSWSETWYAIAGTGGPSVASAEGVLSVWRDGASVHVVVGSIGERYWTLRLLQGERLVATREVVVRPDAPYREVLSLDGAGAEGAVTVRVEDDQGRAVMVHTM